MAFGVYLGSSVNAAAIASNAVTNAKMADDAVDTAEIADDAIVAAAIDDGAVLTAAIGDDQVTNVKLANIPRGSVKVGGGSNAPTDLDAKTSGQILVGDGTDILSVAVSGDATLAANGALTIAADAVEGTMLNSNAADGSTLTLSSDSLSVLKVPNALTAGTGIAAGGTFDGAAARTISVAAAQTSITSILNDGLTKIGRDDGSSGNQDFIDFASAGSIILKTNDVARLTASDTGIVIAGNLTVSGTTTTVDTTNLLVKDKLVTLNDGGAAASAGGSGIEFEEDGSATGFIKVAADRLGFEFQAPANNNTLTIDATAAGKTITAGGSLNIEADSVINQDLSSDAVPSFGGLDLNGNLDGSTGAFDITIVDNNATALEIKEGGNTYMAFDTADSGGEQIVISKKIDYNASVFDASTQATSFMMKDNQADCIEFKESTNLYMAFDTSNGSERIKISKPLAFMGAMSLDIADNQASGLSFGPTGKADMLKFMTTNSKESLVYSSGTCFIPQSKGAAGSSVADATQITAGATLVVCTSDSSAKGVKLPPAADLTVGQYMIVVNKSGVAFKLYPEDSDAEISGMSLLDIPANGSIGVVLVDDTPNSEKWMAI
tara:strand:+ start:70976 stop:72796 length:1821 start_codon:yes stop_codon:yes gene_type:complete